MIYKYKLFILFCLLLLGLNAHSKEFPYIQFENFTYENGLPDNMIYQIVKDKSGFVWIGTSHGLVRYDGANFKAFYHNDDNINTPIGNQIKCLLVDSENYLWIGTQDNGVSRYNTKTSTYTHYLHDPDNPNTLNSRETLCLLEDSKGQIWVGTEKGLNVIDKQHGVIAHFMPDDKDSTSLSKNAVLSLLEDSKGRIWVGTWEGGLNLLLPSEAGLSGATFKHFKHNSLNQESISGNNVWSLFEDSKQRIWVGTFNNGLNLMIPDAEYKNEASFSPQFIHYKNNPNRENSIPNNAIYTINEDKNALLWVGTGHGIGVADLSKVGNIQFIDAHVPHTIPDLGFKTYRQNNYDVSLIDNLTRNIFVDDIGCIWIGTSGGISRYDSPSIRFRAMMTPSETNFNYSIQSIIVEDAHTHWLGVWDTGLVKYNPQTGDREVFNADPSNPTALANANVLKILRLESGDIWLGTNSGYSIFNIHKETFTNYVPQDTAKKIQDIRVSSYLKDSKGRVWIGTGSGLTRVYEDENPIRYELMEIKTNNNPNPLTTEATTITEDIHGNIWLTTWNGLNKLSPDANGEFVMQQYIHLLKDTNSICSNRITGMAIKNDNYWIATEAGLSRYLPEEDRFINYGKKQGLHMTNMTSLQIDDENQVWGATRQGLFCLNPDTKEIQYFFKEDGLQGNTFNWLSTARDQHGNFYFGGNQGYSTFVPKDIKPNQHRPQIVITGFEIFNKEQTFDQPLHTLDEIELSHEQNYFTIRFAALNYIQSSRNQYQYKLEGFDEDWINSGNRNFVSYTNLNGGTYTFRVKGSNNDKKWNEIGTSIKIKVIPPFWWTWWFWGIIIASALFIIYLYNYYRNKAIRKRSYELEAYNAKLNAEIEVRQRTEDRLREREQKLTEAEKQLEDTVKELQRSNKELEQFAYIASHDLQEPLRMVGSFVQLIGKRYSDKIDDAGQEYIGFAVDGVNRMSGLIKGLLSFSRVGLQNANFELCNLNAVLEKKMLDIRNYIEERQAIVSIGTLPDSVFCDATQIGAIFYNLIVNAIKFNKKEKPCVEVGLVSEDDKIYLFQVKDNGIGISQEYKERVFEIFKRLNSNDEFKGSGIGLALCKRIVDNHEGEIWFESEEGEGTTFFFSINKHLDKNQSNIYETLKKERALVASE